MLVLVLVSQIGSIASSDASQPSASTSEELTDSARQVFSQIAGIYRSGGSAPELVAELNSALELIREARYKRLGGDESGALVLEEQARLALSNIMNKIPAAQQKAQHEATIRTIMVIVYVPVVVALSTFIFYVALRTWRWYEKSRLFEMRIVEKKKEMD
jgi:hypothetical protein